MPLPCAVFACRWKTRRLGAKHSPEPSASRWPETATRSRWRQHNAPVTRLRPGLRRYVGLRQARTPPAPTSAHQRGYGETRPRLGVGAQLAVCARAKAVVASKAVKAKHREEPTGPHCGRRGRVRDDARPERVLSLDRVWLNTLDGRVVCRLLLGTRQHGMLGDLAGKIGGADLVWRRGVVSPLSSLLSARHPPPRSA